jgi:hypothetical protein
VHHQDRGGNDPEVVGSIGAVAGDELTILVDGPSLGGVGDYHPFIGEGFLALPGHLSRKVSEGGGHRVCFVRETKGQVTLVRKLISACFRRQEGGGPVAERHGRDLFSVGLAEEPAQVGVGREGDHGTVSPRNEYSRVGIEVSNLRDLFGVFHLVLEALVEACHVLVICGIGHISRTTAPPVGVAMSKEKPASRKWSIGTNISTGWFPVLKVAPLAIFIPPISVQTTRIGLVPVYLASTVCGAYLVFLEVPTKRVKGDGSNVPSSLFWAVSGRNQADPIVVCLFVGLFGGGG